MGTHHANRLDVSRSWAYARSERTPCRCSSWTGRRLLSAYWATMSCRRRPSGLPGGWVCHSFEVLFRVGFRLFMVYGLFLWFRVYGMVYWFGLWFGSWFGLTVYCLWFVFCFRLYDFSSSGATPVARLQEVHLQKAWCRVLKQRPCFSMVSPLLPPVSEPCSGALFQQQELAGRVLQARRARGLLREPRNSPEHRPCGRYQSPVDRCLACTGIVTCVFHICFRPVGIWIFLGFWFFRRPFVSGPVR